MRAAELGHEAVELARHVGDVRVAEPDHAGDAVSAEVREHVVGVQPVSNVPGVAIEPTPDGVEHAWRKQVDVGVDEHGRLGLRPL